MNKNAIKNYAIWARNELITRVTQKAFEYGVSKDNIIDSNADSINGRLLTAEEKQQRQKLVSEVKEKGFEQVMEEVAYTWFNRFIALRYMEVNNYLPNRVRVFTNENNDFKPQILDEAANLELEGLDREKVYQLLESNKNEELYKLLLLATCNDMHTYLPGMFETIDDFKVLMFPENLLRNESVLGKLISDIDAESWLDQIQIIGWLYQFYNSDLKDEVFAKTKKVKMDKIDVPAATQLFTPNWICEYMIENSLGRLWLEKDSTSSIKNLPHFIQENIFSESKKNIAIEQITFFDPCMGSGHVLVCAFDIFMKIYIEQGWKKQDAVESILKNNLYGLDIDNRAYQLAYFSVMMKARFYDRKILKKGIKINIYPIQESNSFPFDYLSYIHSDLAKEIQEILNEMVDAKEYGSLVQTSSRDYLKILRELSGLEDNLFADDVRKQLVPIILVAELLAKKYDVVVTNPPYMGNRMMSVKLTQFVKVNYPDSKSDMFSVFIEKCRDFTKDNSYYAMITQPSFLFLTAFEKLRKKIINSQTLISLLHMGRGIFGVDFGSTAFVIKNQKNKGYSGQYMRLHQSTFQYIDAEQIEDIFLNANENHDYKFNFSKLNISEDENITLDYEQQIYYQTNQTSFLEIPGTPIAYWLSTEFLKTFKGKKIGDYANVITGMTTGNNTEFLRLWYEVPFGSISIKEQKMSNINFSAKKWIPYSKGGDRRNWYGNYDYVVNWTRKDEFNRSKTTLQHLYLKEALTWPFISSGKFSARYLEPGFLWDVAGSPAFVNDEKFKYYILGFMCTKLADKYLKIMNPTINIQAIDIAKLPLIINDEYHNEIDNMVKQCIELSKADWDSFETSWDYQIHPIVRYARDGQKRKPWLHDEYYPEGDSQSLEWCYLKWNEECENRFKLVKKYEEQINTIFNKIYKLENEIDSTIIDTDVTVRKADINRDIKSLISYAVGCMFGRYSLDVEGLVFAGGEWNNTKYSVFIPDADNIIPICDDEYFPDDIVGRFIEFVKVVYGEESLEENLEFISKALGGKGTPREILRNYFLNDFFKDHCNTYQVTGSGKRPIYWLFDSGKKNGFKALIYIHRYTPDLIARMRTQYIHEQQARYRNQIEMLEKQVDSDISTSERVRLNKQLKKFREQDEELRKYEEKIHHWADRMEPMDLDDGVKANYAKFQELLAKIK